MTKKVLPFWTRTKPSKKYNIALLHPKSLPTGERFETHQDVQRESIRSESLLRRWEPSSGLADALAECRAGDYSCNQPFCPVCAREFRRWFIWQVLRLAGCSQELRVVTVLLKKVRPAHLGDVDIEKYRDLLRKRLSRSGFNGVVIGGFEAAYKAKERIWVFHAHLLFIDVDRDALSKFKQTFSWTGFHRPRVSQPVRNKPKQISYLLKFATYHRLHSATKGTKGNAKPLNPAQHHELVKWFSQHAFEQFVFLFQARRRGEMIRPTA